MHLSLPDSPFWRLFTDEISALFDLQRVVIWTLATRCKDSLHELAVWNVIFLFSFCLKLVPDLLLILSCSSPPFRRGPAPREEGRDEGPRVIPVNYIDKGHLCGGQRWVPEDLTGYCVEQHRRSQLGSENQSDFLAQMKFAPSDRQEGTGGRSRCTAATLRISSFVSAWLLECLSSWKLCHTNPSCRVLLVPERGHQGPGRKEKHTGAYCLFPSFLFCH